MLVGLYLVPVGTQPAHSTESITAERNCTTLSLEWDGCTQQRQQLQAGQQQGDNALDQHCNSIE